MCASTAALSADTCMGLIAASCDLFNPDIWKTESGAKQPEIAGEYLVEILLIPLSAV